MQISELHDPDVLRGTNVTTNKKKKHENEVKEELEELSEEEQVAPEGSIEALDDSVEDPDELEPEDELSKLKAEAAEYLDGWQRARAEFANYKKRIERENEDSRQRVISELMLNYLGIMDDLERALENAPQNEEAQEWVSGIELIYQKFNAILEAEGVAHIEADGERFDPNLHEAISYEETDEYEGGDIIAVTQRGYMLGDRIIRPAMVRVAK